MLYYSIVNGPNLNWLGKRDPKQYGSQDWQTVWDGLTNQFSNKELRFFQSNIEGEIINYLQDQEDNQNCLGIIINAGGFSHTSVAIADCIEAMKTPVIAVHISNTHSREIERQRDLVAASSNGSIIGFGVEGYAIALKTLIEAK